MRISVLIAFLLLCVNLQAEEIPQVHFQPYEFKTFNGTTVKAELGDLVVPENRQVAGARKIHLRFVRFAGTKKGSGSPIIYLAGGPGGSGIDAARGPRFPLFMALRDYGDVIAFDQRGTGMSEPDLFCNESYTLPFSEPTDRAKAGKIVMEAARQCFDRLRKGGIDLSGYNTRENAADINDLRAALGAKRISLWGISYGTHLALATMKYYGNTVDRVILAGVEPLNHTYKLPQDQQNLLETISQLVRSQPEISKTLPDLTGSVRKLLQKLEQHPESVSLTHPLNEMKVDIRVGAFDLQYILSQMLDGPGSFAVMPDLITRLEKGDWTALALLSAQLKQGEAPNAMSVAMDCSSGQSKEWKEMIADQAKNALLGDAINFPFPEICDGLPDLGDDFRKPFSSDIPTLIISGTLDGRTPPSTAEQIIANFKNARRILIEGAGHSDPLFLSSPKILDAMKGFLESRSDDQQKIAVSPDPFVIPRTVVDLSEDILNRYVGTYEIKDKDLRRVMKAGNILWTQRGDNPPRPIRPMSETEFFYEGSATSIQFELKPVQKTKPVTGTRYAFVNGRWFNGKTFTPQIFYSIDGVLTATKPEKIDHEFDLANRFVVPPFGEAHNHNVEQSSGIDGVIQSYLNAGVFYVKNPNNLPRSRWPLTGKINVPESIDVTFANGGLTSTGGHPIEIADRNMKRQVWKAEDGEGAFYFVIDSRKDLDTKWNQILEARPDFIKTYLLYSEEFEKRSKDASFYGWRGLDPTLLPEIVRRAHAAGLTVSTHIESAADFHNAVVAGVDEINHLPGFRPEKEDPANYVNYSRYEISEEDARKAGEKQIAVVTTIGDLIGVLNQIPNEAPQAQLATQIRNLMKQNLTRLVNNHVRIAIGSDSYDDTSLKEAMNLKSLGVFDNLSLLKLWCEATPQLIFPKRKIGELLPGYEASFLVLNANPLEDFSNVTKIHMRFKQGHMVDTDAVSAVKGMIVFQEGHKPGEPARFVHR